MVYGREAFPVVPLLETVPPWREVGRLNRSVHHGDNWHSGSRACSPFTECPQRSSAARKRCHHYCWLLAQRAFIHVLRFSDGRADRCCLLGACVRASIPNWRTFRDGRQAHEVPSAKGAMGEWPLVGPQL